MSRIALIALIAALALPAASGATTRNQQLYDNVSREMPYFVPDAEISELSNTQLAQIYNIMHSKRSHGEKTALIKSVLGGPHSLRSLLFGN